MLNFLFLKKSDLLPVCYQFVTSSVMFIYFFPLSDTCLMEDISTCCFLEGLRIAQNNVIFQLRDVTADLNKVYTKNQKKSCYVWDVFSHGPLLGTDTGNKAVGDTVTIVVLGAATFYYLCLLK